MSRDRRVAKWRSMYWLLQWAGVVVGTAALGCGGGGESGGESSSGGVSAPMGGMGGRDATDGGTATSGGRRAAGGAGADGWLYTEGNHIYRADGSVFHGRGVNLQDTRSCWRCAWNEPNPAEVMRRIDALVDDWHANFIRLTLESYGNDSEEHSNGAVQYGSVLEDPDYLADIEAIIAHAGTKPGLVVLLSLWTDPSHNDMGWPTTLTQDTWRLLARTFGTTPHVMFGIVNEPQSNSNGALDGDVWTAMNDAVEAIRDEEDQAGTPHHVITVQGTGGWARYLTYYIDHPIQAGGGENIAYEVHVYDPQSTFDERFVTPSATLPVVIGEFGPAESYMTMADCSALMPLAEEHEVPYLAWTFHMNCPPNLLEDTENGCHAGTELRPSAWGQLLQDRLAQPW